LQQRKQTLEAHSTTKTKASDIPAKTAQPTSKNNARKLSYKQQRELEELPGRIEALEHEQTELQTRLNDAGFYQQDKDTVAQTLARLKEIETELEQCFERWAALE